MRFPVLARLQVTEPPPGPEPMTMASYRSSFIGAFKDYVRSIVEGVARTKPRLVCRRLPIASNWLARNLQAAEFADIRAPIKAWI